MTKDPIVTPFSARYGPNGMVCSTDQLASSAGVALLRKGGSAAAAAVAAAAATRLRLSLRRRVRWPASPPPSLRVFFLPT